MKQPFLGVDLIDLGLDRCFGDRDVGLCLCKDIIKSRPEGGHSVLTVMEGKAKISARGFFFKSDSIFPLPHPGGICNPLIILITFEKRPPDKTLKGFGAPLIVVTSKNWLEKMIMH